IFLLPDVRPLSDIPTLSLHDALPILAPTARVLQRPLVARPQRGETDTITAVRSPEGIGMSFWKDVDPAIVAQVDQGDAAIEHYRSEEHTSELQSRENIVCRLLLDKKK